jgi:hypothetical protein
MGVAFAEIGQREGPLYQLPEPTSRSIEPLFPLDDSAPLSDRESVTIEPGSEITYFLIRNQADEDFRTLNRLFSAGAEAVLIERAWAAGKSEAPDPSWSRQIEPGMIAVAANAMSRDVLKYLPADEASRILEVRGGGSKLGLQTRAIRVPRIAVYQPWVPSMDEGWTRLVLEKFRFTYATLHNAEIRAGDLRGRLDVLILPSVEPKVLRDGFGKEETEPSYVGGLGREGSEALRQFVAEGGTLISLEQSCPYAIAELKLGVTEVLKGLGTSAFYCPGSILRVRYETRDVRPAEPFPLTLGMPSEGAVYFDRSLAFDASKTRETKVWAAYESNNVLESGWLLGATHIQDKAALVEVKQGKGRVVLFGFPPQHRGQTHATFRLLFNAILGACSVP